MEIWRGGGGGGGGAKGDGEPRLPEFSTQVQPQRILSEHCRDR